MHPDEPPCWRSFLLRRRGRTTPVPHRLRTSSRRCLPVARPVAPAANRVRRSTGRRPRCSMSDRPRDRSSSARSCTASPYEAPSHRHSYNVVANAVASLSSTAQPAATTARTPSFMTVFATLAASSARGPSSIWPRWQQLKKTKSGVTGRLPMIELERNRSGEISRAGVRRIVGVEVTVRRDVARSDTPCGTVRGRSSPSSDPAASSPTRVGRARAGAGSSTTGTPSTSKIRRVTS